ncbi:MAG: hypothetical protein IT443_11990 [Phycisphaeraceae bacterium]|nr:hypothetical protein [Phycisphaeraceae bacterium]
MPYVTKAMRESAYDSLRKILLEDPTRARIYFRRKIPSSRHLHSRYQFWTTTPSSLVDITMLVSLAFGLRRFKDGFCGLPPSRQNEEVNVVLAKALADLPFNEIIPVQDWS